MSTCRYFETAYIPWTAVKDYVLSYGGSLSDVEFLARLLNELDELMFRDMQTKSKPADPSPAGKRKRIIGEKNGGK